MSNTKHTPGPWRSAEQDGLADWTILSDDTTVVVAHGASEQDARRIVACVNACESITDNELTHGPVIALHKYSYVVNEREELKADKKLIFEQLKTRTDERDAMKEENVLLSVCLKNAEQQRDELLAALQRISGLSTYDETATEEAMAEIQAECRAAIAKAKS